MSEPPDNPPTDFTPRNYQVQLMETALKKNTIIYLPTGTGKTFIALLVLKRLSGKILKSYSEGGQLTIIIVNTVTLVEQHGKYFQNHTSFNVGCFSGELNTDYWPKEKWLQEFEKNQILIMTAQILYNLLIVKFIELDKINLLIFDECHRAVNDNPMRLIMKCFENVSHSPRVLGLTATLLNGNCTLAKVCNEVMALETTLHAKVAAATGLEDVVGFSTNPNESFVTYCSHRPSEIEALGVMVLRRAMSIIDKIKLPAKSPKLFNLKKIVPVDYKKKALSSMQNLIFHIELMGITGGIKACLSELIKIERLKRNCQEKTFFVILQFIWTTIVHVHGLFENRTRDYNEGDKIYKCCSNKVLQLIELLKQYKRKTPEEMCALVFTQRRITAKLLHHIVADCCKFDEELSHVKSNFIVGFNNNPYNDTRESLFFSKKNKEVFTSFVNKEINCLFASNVLEEGIDMPTCTLVIKFDKPEDFRAYIQSKGRARHRNSLFYMMVERTEMEKYATRKYVEFQEIEATLNKFLIGQNDVREEPDPDEIQKMYDEEEFPLYYVNGPNSAVVNMHSAIPLLCQYCSSLPSDIYIQYAPDWYVEEIGDKTRVIIVLPTVCPITNIITGPLTQSLKLAKRAAALECCKQLHQIGELNDNLSPKPCSVVEDDVSFLFSHHPEVKEKMAGTNKNKRLHEKQIAKCLKEPISPNKSAYLHIIRIEPEFGNSESNVHQSALYEAYTNDLCFGIVSARALPQICAFTIFVALGALNIRIQMNARTIEMDENKLAEIKEFHFMIFNDVVQVVKGFFHYDNTANSEMLLVVPIDKNTLNINYDIIAENKTINSVIREPTLEEKQNLEVTQETYGRSIVSPWYRQTIFYIVSEIFFNKTPLSAFPNEEFSNFVEYFQDKYSINIVNKDQPLLLVKALSIRFNLYKPRRAHKMFKREEMVELLVPELLVKQNLPSSLWIQANCLPTILSRMCYLILLEELRLKIASEAQFTITNTNDCKPLCLNKSLAGVTLHENQKIKQTENTEVDCAVEELKPGDLNTKGYNRDFVSKTIESQYSWSNLEEPKDINRELDVTILDIEHYDLFVNKKISTTEKKYQILGSPSQVPALTYHKEFVDANIEVIKKKFNPNGPDLASLYAAFTTAKANDIVNLERMETLGDSFLKLVASLYVTMRFPKFNVGQSVSLKGRLVSNKNLYYLAAKKNFGGILKNHDLSKDEWMPLCYTSPEQLVQKIVKRIESMKTLFLVNIESDEQISGVLSEETLKAIDEESYKVEENEEDAFHSVGPFLKRQYVGDKVVADAVESLLGCYLDSSGFEGATRLMEWLGLFPKSENIHSLFTEPAPNPVLNPSNALGNNIDLYLPQWKQIQATLGYEFKNPAYLLQALTHSSFSTNRITMSYEKLELIGDAIMDFLITSYIFESCGKLSPGELTDLRSALVNNCSFASYTVRCGFHKHMLFINVTLQKQIDKFAEYFKNKQYQIDEEVLILLEEEDLNIAECIDVPKVLGDVFESLVGAVYLDSGKNLEVVWKVFYKIMWKEIDLFSQNVPINIIRKLFEWKGAYAKFGKIQESQGRTVIPLEFMMNGHKKVVYGFGSNKFNAKKAAAKLAVQFLQK